MTTERGIKSWVRAVPGVGTATKRIAAMRQQRAFRGSADYWEDRYASGGNSGEGSYGMWAEYKADYLNRFVRENGVETVIEWGCGDGNQLALARYPVYIGIDVSDTAVAQCVDEFAGDSSKSFFGLRTFVDNAGVLVADLALSLDVIYHLVEDEVFEHYMAQLFASGSRFVVIYSTVEDRAKGLAAPHVRRRDFRPWVTRNAQEWELVEHVQRPGKTSEYEADFVTYRRVDNASSPRARSI